MGQSVVKHNLTDEKITSVAHKIVCVCGKRKFYKENVYGQKARVEAEMQEHVKQNTTNSKESVE